MPQDVTQTTQSQSSTKKPQGEWLRTRLSTLYNSDLYKRGNTDDQNHFKRQAYNNWVVPYFHKVFKDKPPFSEEEFLNNKQYIDRLQSEQFYAKARSQDKKNLYAGVKSADKGISSVSSFLGALTSVRTTPYTKQGQQSYDESSGLTQFFKTGEKYYDKQAQDMEDRIQDLGGHNVASRFSELVGSAAMFEATGAAKGANLFKIANPKTTIFAKRILTAEWNGVVTGLFWGVSTGTKPEDLGSEGLQWAAFNVAGEMARPLVGFVKTFSKVSTPEVTKNTVDKAVRGLLTDGIKVPSQKTFNPANVQENEKAAIAGMARVLNTLATTSKIEEQVKEVSDPRNVGKFSTRDAAGKFVSLEQRIMKAEDMNGAFKSLSPKQQKIVISRLMSVLSQAHDQAANDLTRQVSEVHLKEQEQRTAEAVKQAPAIQAEIDKFISTKVSDPSEVSKVKLGAVLERHNTTEDSPLGHVAARLSWLRKQLDMPGVNSKDKEVIVKAIEEEKELFNKIKAKEVKKKSN